MGVWRGSLAVGKRGNGSACLGGKLFTCPNYGVWNKAFPHRPGFRIPFFVLDTLSSKRVTVIVLEPYVPIDWVCMVRDDMT